MATAFDPRAIPPAALVEHAAFVRRVAYAVLRDDADADDAAQDALARGLTAGPRDAGARRSWLAAVVRNVGRRMRRGDARRAAREEATARAEATPSALSAAERQETLRAVVDAVGALDEPSRIVVLLRHYEALPPREIAARLGVPVETVKKRLQRAHQALRRRLEGEGPREGERRRFALAALAGIPPPRPAGPATAGALAGKGAVMAIGAKTAVLVGAVVAAIGGPLAWERWSAPAGSEPAGESTAAVRSPGGPGLLGRAPSAPAPSSPVEVASKAPPATWMAHDRGRASFILPREWTEDESGHVPGEFGMWHRRGTEAAASWAVVSRAEALAVAAGLASPSRSSVSLADRGGAHVRGTLLEGGVEQSVLVILANPWQEREESTAIVVRVPAAEGAATWTALERPIDSVRIVPRPATVVDAIGDVPGDVIEIAAFVEGVPAEGVASLEVWGTDMRLDDAGNWTSSRTQVGRAPLEGGGRARFEALKQGIYDVYLDGPALGGHRVNVELAGRAETAHSRVVLSVGGGELSGRVYARDGTPAANVPVWCTENGVVSGPPLLAGFTRTDAEGRYRMRGLPEGYQNVGADLPALGGMPQASRGAPARIRNSQPAVLDLGTADRLPIWRGTVRETDGSAAVGRGRLTFVDLKPPPGLSEWEGALIRSDGAFEARVRPARYRVQGQLVYPDAAPREIASIEVQIPEGGLERDLVVGGGSLDVRIRRASGSLEGVEIWMGPADAGKAGSQGSFTDPTGVARFRGVVAGRYRVWIENATVKMPDGGAAEVEIQDRPAFLDVELTAPAK